MPSGSPASKAARIRACISSIIFFCIGATSGSPMKARASSGVMSIVIFTFIGKASGLSGLGQSR